MLVSRWIRLEWPHVMESTPVTLIGLLVAAFVVLLLLTSVMSRE